MSKPIFFVVERDGHGGESPAIYHDLLPERLMRKIPRDNRGQLCEPSPIIYAVRLDLLPDAHRWLAEFLKKPLAEIYTEYCRRRDGQELPISNLATTKKAAEPARRLAGEFWAPPARTWEDRPPDPYPSPDDIKPRSSITIAEEP